MCGVAGVMNLEDREPPSIEMLTAMVSSLRHRGPDEFGLFRDGVVGLSHARLSIIDLATGQQPMTDDRESLWVVFNGEVFNFVELRAELEALGYRFRTHSDTEVIVHGFRQWGVEVFARFNGQFAVALWDQEQQELTLARDRFGVRPLYWCERDGRLLFASEVRALLAGAPSMALTLDPVGLAETFTFWATVAPQTVFHGINEVEPGTVRVCSPRGHQVHRYWDAAFPTDTGETYHGTPEEAAAETLEALEASVRLRLLRADVPVGAYLSGGLDSSLVVALASRMRPQPLTTFAIRFEDPEYDEGRYQARVATAIGTEHHELMVRNRDLADVFPQVVLHAERPLLRTAPAPMYLLSDLVQRHGLKVVLTGEGADEMFGGYDLFREARIRRFWARRPDSTMRPLLLDRLYPYLGRPPVGARTMSRSFFGRDLHRSREAGFGHFPRWRSTAALQRLFAPDLQRAMARSEVVERLTSRLPVAFPDWGELAQDQYLEVRTLLSGYLLSSQGDRMLMAHSVEGRFPFLDTGVVRLANRLPSRLKLQGLTEKAILKRVARGLVPDEVIDRPKQPYRAPDAAAMAGSDRPDWVSEVMSPDSIRGAGVFDPDAVAHLWRKCQDASSGGRLTNTDNMGLVGVLSTAILLGQRASAVPGADIPTRFRTLVDHVRERPVGR